MKVGESLVTIFFFFIIMLIGITSVFSNKEEISYIENRRLSKMPELHKAPLLNGEYFEDIEEYYNDHIPFKTKWIESKHMIEKVFFRKDVVDSVYVHPNGYLLSVLKANSNMLTPEKISDNVDVLINSIDTNIKVSFALVPNKTVTMEQDLPGYLGSEANNISDKLLKELNKNEKLITMDLRESTPKQLENLYFYTDHHWKSKGAFYAYKQIISELNKKNEIKLKEYNEDDFIWEEIQSAFLGSEARKTSKAYVKKYDSLTKVTPKFSEEIKVCYSGECFDDFYDEDSINNPPNYSNQYKYYLGGDHKEIIITNKNEDSGRKLLIMKDSYANPLIEFLARSYKNTYVVDLRHMGENSIYNYIKEKEISDIVFIHNVNSLCTTPTLTTFK